MNEIHINIIKKYPEYKHTCSIENPKDWCITFIRNKKRVQVY